MKRRRDLELNLWFARQFVVSSIVAFSLVTVCLFFFGIFLHLRPLSLAGFVSLTIQAVFFYLSLRQRRQLKKYFEGLAASNMPRRQWVEIKVLKIGSKRPVTQEIDCLDWEIEAFYLLCDDELRGIAKQPKRGHHAKPKRGKNLGMGKSDESATKLVPWGIGEYIFLMLLVAGFFYLAGHYNLTAIFIFGGVALIWVLAARIDMVRLKIKEAETISNDGLIAIYLVSKIDGLVRINRWTFGPRERLSMYWNIITDDTAKLLVVDLEAYKRDVTANLRREIRELRDKCSKNPQSTRLAERLEMKLAELRLFREEIRRITT